MSIYDHDEQDLTDLGISVPSWIFPCRLDQERLFITVGYMSTYDLAGVVEGGCASGAWMPAVTYHTANKIMSEYGDAVLDYIENMGLHMEVDGRDMSWGEIACHFLSMAVECWCAEHEEMAQNALLEQRDEQPK